MDYNKLCDLRAEAWQAFFDVFRANGYSEDVLQKLRNSLNRKDCYNDVDDCLVEVFCDE